MGQHSSGRGDGNVTGLRVRVASTHILREGKQRDVGTGGSALQWDDGTLHDLGLGWRLLTPCETASRGAWKGVGQHSSGRGDGNVTGLRVRVASTHILREGKQRDVGTGGSALQRGDGTLQGMMDGCATYFAIRVTTRDVEAMDLYG